MMAVVRTSRCALNAGARAFSTAVAPDGEWGSARPYSDIPGPKPLLLLGNSWRLAGGKYDFTNLISFQQQLRQEFGNIVSFPGLLHRNDLLFVYDPDDIEKVFRFEGRWPSRPSLKCLTYYRTVVRKDFFEGLSGVLNDQGEAWQQARSQVNPVMMQTKTVQLYTQRINDVAQDFVGRVPEWRDGNNEMSGDFKNELHKWALESIAMIALDTRLGCLAPNLAPDSEPQRMIDAVHTLFLCMHKLEIGPGLWTILPSRTLNKFVATMDFFVEFCMKYITRAMEKENKPGDETSVLQRFLERDPNPKRAVIMALDMLFAGVDTTSYSVANTLLHVARNPDKQEKLYAELCQVMPDIEVPLTPEILNQLTYLKACIRETTRLTPVATGNMRSTQNKMVLSGYQVPVGVDIIMANGSISRREENFPDADKFVPERWLRQRGDSKDACPYPEHKINPFASLPFGHGSRKCVGMRFANLEMEVLLSKLVRRFRWDWRHGEVQYRSTLIHAPVTPLRFTVTHRE